eukprot:4964507-Pyramimonas_sp.AAC.1
MSTQMVAQSWRDTVVSLHSLQSILESTDDRATDNDCSRAEHSCASVLFDDAASVRGGTLTGVDDDSGPCMNFSAVMTYLARRCPGGINSRGCVRERGDGLPGPVALRLDAGSRSAGQANEGIPPALWASGRR